MKKQWLRIFILITVLLSGCSQNSVPLEEYQRVLREKELILPR